MAEIRRLLPKFTRLLGFVMSDEDFTPKLGRTRSKDGKKVVKYGGRVLAAARLAGTKTGVRSRRFDGSRIGRGASIGRYFGVMQCALGDDAELRLAATL